jgi:hypothetical protein
VQNCYRDQNKIFFKKKKKSKESFEKDKSFTSVRAFDFTSVIKMLGNFLFGVKKSTEYYVYKFRHLVACAKSQKERFLLVKYLNSAISCIENHPTGEPSCLSFPYLASSIACRCWLLVA